MDGLAGRKPDGQADLPDRHALNPRADEVHFDAPKVLIVDGPVLEGTQFEVAVQFVVDAGQQIAVEGRRHTCGIVIGCFQNGPIFPQVHADQQSIQWRHDALDAPDGPFRRSRHRRLLPLLRAAPD